MIVCIYGRGMDYEPWSICAMTIIKMRLSELIVNVNNLTKAADMHMNEIMCISDRTTNDSYRQIISLFSTTWKEFEDGPFLPENDIKRAPETMCKYTLQRKFEFILWLVISNTINIRMRIRMYTDALSSMRGQLRVITQRKEHVDSTTQEVGHGKVKILRNKIVCRNIDTQMMWKKVCKETGNNNLKMKKEGVSSKTGKIKYEAKGMCRRHLARKQKEEAKRKITSINDIMKAYSYVF